MKKLLTAAALAAMVAPFAAQADYTFALVPKPLTIRFLILQEMVVTKPRKNLQTSLVNI